MSTVANLPPVPASHPVQPLEFMSDEYHNARARDALAQCGTCSRLWDDGTSTSMTPTPGGRCPFEEFHADPVDDGDDLRPVNASRAGRIADALESAGYEGALDWRGTVADALCDLRHLCDREGLDFAQVDRSAYGHYSAERDASDAEAQDSERQHAAALPAGAQPIAYKETNGTHYRAETPADVVDALERARASRDVVRVFYGDTATGAAWAEESDVVGRIGRSMGAGPSPVRVPLLVAPGQDGGGAMLDHCVVAIMSAPGRFAYRHRTFSPGVWTVQPSDLPDYAANVDHNGETYARCKTIAKADRLRAFMLGERMRP